MSPKTNAEICARINAATGADFDFVFPSQFAAEDVGYTTVANYPMVNRPNLRIMIVYPFCANKIPKLNEGPILASTFYLN